ncbi:cupin domain-containing protein [Halopolyspora algeriensis]|uniref:cupin domain-containing protein n=1 Tax=Halopolyspora algeriensis TaxID=1500506 RepID=UPI000DF3A825|nr:cupin domain-containing protein [Halopolyspora algeriensis]
MDKFSLEALGREHLERASQAASGRSAGTVYGGHEHMLRQTLVALNAGAYMDEHESPGEATVLVLQGRMRLSTSDTSWDGLAGDMVVVPAARHSVHALEETVILLTVVKRV